jgi:hypothetical protein
VSLTERRKWACKGRTMKEAEWQGFVLTRSIKLCQRRPALESPSIDRSLSTRNSEYTYCSLLLINTVRSQPNSWHDLWNIQRPSKLPVLKVLKSTDRWIVPEGLWRSTGATWISNDTGPTPSPKTGSSLMDRVRPLSVDSALRWGRLTKCSYTRNEPPNHVFLPIPWSLAGLGSMMNDERLFGHIINWLPMH